MIISCDRDLADKIYADSQRRMTWRERLFTWRIRIEGWLMGVLRIIPVLVLLAVLWPAQPVAADEPHHICAAWCARVLAGKAPGVQYFNAGGGKVYAWVKASKRVVIMKPNGMGMGFISQFRPLDGIDYVKRAVYKDARAVGYSSAQATYLARGASSLRGALAMRVVQGVTRVAGTVAGAAGIGVLFVPCQAVEEVLAGVRCTGGVRQ